MGTDTKTCLLPPFDMWFWTHRRNHDYQVSFSFHGVPFLSFLADFKITLHYFMECAHFPILSHFYLNFSLILCEFPIMHPSLLLFPSPHTHPLPLQPPPKIKSTQTKVKHSNPLAMEAAVCPTVSHSRPPSTHLHEQMSIAMCLLEFCWTPQSKLITHFEVP